MDLTLQQIKNEIAIKKGYFSWSNLISSGHLTITLNTIDELLILVQKECLNNASKNSNLENIRDSAFKSNYDIVNYVNYGMWGTEKHSVSVNKESITDENNIIK